MSDMESVLKMSKKGKTLMTFVNVDPSFSREKTEEVTKLWQSSLWNSHIQAERYLIQSLIKLYFFFILRKVSMEFMDYAFTSYKINIVEKYCCNNQN